MIKGAQKQMIVVRTGESRYFDEAYFVLRREIRAPKGKRNDILLEADRILRETDTEAPKRDLKRSLRNVLLFLAGILCGGAVAVLVFLLTL